MRTKLLPWLFVLAAAVASSGQDKTAPSDKKSAAPKSLLRMDLLQMKARPTAAVKRDIFLPQSPSGPAGLPPDLSAAPMGERRPSRSPRQERPGSKAP